MSKQVMPAAEVLSGLYRSHGGRVYARCLFLLKNPEEAKDATQDVFIKVHTHIESFRQEASPLTWMTRIATNHCLNVLRARRAPWHEHYRREVETGVTSADGHFHLLENAELLRLCLARVCEQDPQLAELATYAFVDDMRQQDICRDELSTHVPGITFADAPI